MVLAEEREAAARPLRSVLPASPTTELLSGLLLEGSETAYAAAARRREAAGAAGATGTGGGRTALLLVVGLALTGAVLGVAAAQERERAPVDSAGRAALVAETDERLAAVDRLQSDVRVLRTRVEAARRGALSAAGGAQLARRVEELEQRAGAAPVSGPGVLVTVDDPERPSGEAAVDGSERVQDSDLQLVVNALWAAGAESVTVNGHRLTSLSAIRSAGAAILVDYVALTPPYAISAIGDPGRLADRFDAGDGGALLRDLAEAFRIRWGLEREPELEHPAASSLSLRYASVADGPLSAASSGASG
ncbi:DUF881 domain-containing protein [Motilibacter aurantiacus]|uniref:DUF881 domain-containing protein n=1 Tax=Motilibacter aurantiacus TaxID=2714955 RepID=UPI0018C8A549|nr:DUF881 domain-containing protein [Motilibacter aurantiacus]NHC47044.1 DUF881 domain-containing protein [Motilibacter aurantiacus]